MTHVASAQEERAVSPLISRWGPTSDVTVPSFLTAFQGCQLPLLGKNLAFSVKNRPERALRTRELGEVGFVTLAKSRLRAPVAQERLGTHATQPGSCRKLERCHAAPSRWLSTLSHLEGDSDATCSGDAQESCILLLTYFLSSTSTTRMGFLPALKTSCVTLASRQPASPDLKFTVSSFFPFSAKASEPSSRMTPT